MDGTPTVRLCDELLEFLADPKSNFKLSPSISVTAPPEPLDFDLTSMPDIHLAISKAQLSLQDLASSHSLSFLRTNYGKAAIKSFGVGPDGWAQMVVQIAYARLAQRFGGENGRVTPWPVGTYEAATTRKFYKGRTETIRVVSNECVAFVQAMLGQTGGCDSVAGIPASLIAFIATRDEKVRLLRDAVKKHSQLAQEAAVGEGVDRHMLGSLLPLPPHYVGQSCYFHQGFASLSRPPWLRLHCSQTPFTLVPHTGHYPRVQFSVVTLQSMDGVKSFPTGLG